jgi:hypothetical protein
VYGEAPQLAGALALVEIIYTVHRREMNSSTDRAPYGLAKYGTAQTSHHVADFLKATNRQNTAKKAA